jgi:hypothetical protein
LTDVRAVVGRVPDSRGDVGEAAAALLQHLDRHDLRVACDPGDADAVARGGGHDAGDVAAVHVLRIAHTVRTPPVTVTARRRTARDEGRARHELGGEVRMTEVDAGVDHRDDGAGAGARRPRLFGVELLQAPLLAVERIVGRRVGGRGGEGKGSQQFLDLLRFLERTVLFFVSVPVLCRCFVLRHGWEFTRRLFAVGVAVSCRPDCFSPHTVHYRLL